MRRSVFAVLMLIVPLAGSAKVNKVSNKKKAKDFKITVDLSTKGHDIAFSPDTLQVPFGHKIILTYKNQADKESGIIHDIAILKPRSKDKVLAKMAKRGYDVDSIVKHFKDDPNVLAVSKTLKPGESDSVSFTPEEKGVHPFICLVPGHGDIMEMQGKLLVQ